MSPVVKRGKADWATDRGAPGTRLLGGEVDWYAEKVV